MTKKNDYLQLLKFIACILITNSHCMYPETMFSIAGASSIFQIGGGWGNAIFFAVSGFLISGKRDSIGKWMKKRYIRILPITVVMGLIWYCLDGLNGNLITFLCTCFWFVSAMMIYYPFFYLFDRIDHGYEKGFAFWGIGYIAYYLARYEATFFVEEAAFAWFKIYAFFGVMLLGGAVKKNIDKVKKVSYMVLLVGVICSGIIWATEYAAIIFMGKGYMLQFMITISRMLFAYCILIFAVKLNDDKPMVLGKNNIINYIADSTLEIYLSQVIAKGIIQKNIVEPWNMFVFWDVALIGGVIVHRIYNVAIRKTVR